MVRATAVLARIPVIKFRKGGLGSPAGPPTGPAAAAPAAAAAQVGLSLIYVTSPHYEIFGLLDYFSTNKHFIITDRYLGSSSKISCVNPTNFKHKCG